VAGLSDEMLMVYADGLAEGELLARVEAQLKIDPEARRRVEMFRATGHELAAHYESTLDEPVPERLKRFVMTYGMAGPPGIVPRAPARRSSQLLGRVAALALLSKELFLQGRATPLVMASAAGLVLGVGFGFWLGGQSADAPSGPELAAFRQGEILAQGALHQVLETLPSNRELRAAGGMGETTVVHALLSFKTKQGGYCREYELNSAVRGQFSGLACRKPGGGWIIEAHVAAAPKPGPGQSVAAGVISGDVLDAIAERSMDGIAFSKIEEAGTIASHWGEAQRR
jgi:hypothetical protein